MRITADITGFLQHHDNLYRDAMLGLWQKMASSHPASGFHFLCGKDAAGFHPAGSNSSLHQLVPKPSSLRYRYWELLQLPAFLKKTKSDLLVSSRLHPLPVSSIPQVWMPVSLDDLPHDRLAIRNIRSLQQIIVFSEAWKQRIQERYSLPEKKIRVLSAALPVRPAPLSFEQKQELKARYSQGREYFLYSGPVSSRQNLLPLFKGFSLFKKRQQSGIRLLLAGEIAAQDKAFRESLQTYKYREEVILTGPLTDQERDQLIAAAYALADPSPVAGPGLIACQAAAAGVALLAAAGQALPEDSYLPTDMLDPVDIASRLMQVYKDESLRNQLIRQAAGVVFPDMAAAAEALWESLGPAQE